MCGCIVRTQYNTLHIHSLYPVLGSTSFMTMGCVIFGDFRFIRWFYGEIGLISLRFIHGICTLRSLCDYIQNKPTFLCDVSCRNIQMKYFSFSSSSSYQDGKKKQLNIVRVITFFKWWFGFLDSLTQKHNIFFSLDDISPEKCSIAYANKAIFFAKYICFAYIFAHFVHTYPLDGACCHCYLQYLLSFFPQSLWCVYLQKST